MRLQEIKGSDGKSAGVFIPQEDWFLIKSSYPDIDSLDKNIPEWQQKLLDERREAIAKNPTSVRPISDLLQLLDFEM